MRYVFGQSGIRAENLLYFYGVGFAMMALLSNWLQERLPATVDPAISMGIAAIITIIIFIGRIINPIVELIVTIAAAVGFAAIAVSFGSRIGNPDASAVVTVLALLLVIASAWEYLKNTHRGEKRWALAW